MIVRIATRVSVSSHQGRFFASSSSHNSNERNIFLEAEEEEEAKASGRSLLEEQKARMAQEPIWDGDERVQDTILRMVMDKYQPLRMKGGGSIGQHPADVKLASIQKPSMLSSPSFTKQSTTPAALIDVDQVSSVLPPTDIDGRRLAKTPEGKPWAAVYVNPMKRDGEGGALTPSVHYGRYLGLPRSSSGRVLPKTASGKERLKLAGIKTESLPIDDRQKMKAIREGVRRWDRAGRMRGVKEEAFNYRRMREEQRNKEDAAMTEDELEAELLQSGILQEGEEMKLGSASDSASGEAQIAMSGGRGFTSVANERIEAMMKTDYFRRNSLRGKPLEKDVHAMNPFLKGEERIMNRLIQRQGASPPWVELNHSVDVETNEWRDRIIDNWVRRASRMILSSSHLRRGLEGLSVDATASFASVKESSLSSGQRQLVTLVEQYRDAEWVAREKQYHEASLKEVNSIIRKYNVVAPSSVRKGLLTRERELQRTYEDSRIRLIRRLSDGLNPALSTPTLSLSQSSSKATSVTSQPLAPRGPPADATLGPATNFIGSGKTGIGGEDESLGGGGEEIDFRTGKRSKTGTPSYNFGFTSLVRRIKEQFAGR